MNNPWYREPWVWGLMAAPAAALFGGAAMLWVAVGSADGLVAEDYYRQGLAINKVLEREEAARTQGISAELSLDKGRISVTLKGAHPQALFAHLAHATRSGHDLRVRLAPGADGAYSAELPPLPAGRWRVVIEDPQASWRIAKEAS
ncbi:MAG TPA: FixH family protein [Burkholderiales bacterium]|nr:FixH family protein [Burkholderiales bacterium]